MKWPLINITTPDGAREAIAPQIISASRSTDIPAFHSQWLLRRLDAGYCKWVNPFSRRPQYVSFQNARAFVFWSKNPEPLLAHLRAFDRRGIAYYFQYTLNNYEAESLEPNLPPLGERVDTFIRISRMLGKERVIWRFDPLLLTENISVCSLAERVRQVGDLLHQHTEKLVISFADVSSYAKVQRNLRNWGGGARELDDGQIDDISARVSEMARDWGLSVATCCERVDLARHGIAHNKCIDDALLLRISRNDQELLRLLRPRPEDPTSCSKLKDPGQRESCGCIVSKDIGAYNTCPHLCAYCYANTSSEAVRRVVDTISGQDEAICP